MPIGLQQSYGYGRQPVGNIISGEVFKNRDERIVSIRESIRIGEVLIHYYQDLIDKDSNCSFAVYKAELDKQAAELQKRYDDLQRQYNAATNGHIPELERQQEELVAKLKQIQGNTKTNVESKARGMNKKVNKIKDLREKIIQLEQELCDATQTDIEELLDVL